MDMESHGALGLEPLDSSAVPFSKFLTIVKQGVLCFHLALGPPQYVTVSSPCTGGIHNPRDTQVSPLQFPLFAQGCLNAFCNSQSNLQEAALVHGIGMSGDKNVIVVLLSYLMLA